MKLLLGALLLLCVCSSWSVSSGTLVVTQSPDLSFQEGETGNITCCWNGTNGRVGIKWLKNQTLIKHELFINQLTVSQNEQKNNCSVLTIGTVMINDSGRYICKVSVEIPALIEVEGNSTTITVRARENITVSTDDHSLNGHGNPSPSRQPALPIVLKCLFFLALISAVFCVHYLVRIAQKNFAGSAAAENNDMSFESTDEDQEEEEGEEIKMEEGAISQEESEIYAAYLEGVLEDNDLYSAEM